VKMTMPAIRLFVAAASLAALASCSMTDADKISSSECCSVGKTTAAITATKTKTYAFATPKPVVKTRHDSGSKPAVSNINASQTAFLGSAPYICSPSGFGRKSACFLR